MANSGERQRFGFGSVDGRSGKVAKLMREKRDRPRRDGGNKK